MANSREEKAITFGLPLRPFMYTLEQVAEMFSVSERTFRQSFVFRVGVDTGYAPRDKLKTIDIRPQDEKKQMWRIPEEELIRWLRHTGFKVYDSAVNRDR